MIETLLEGDGFNSLVRARHGVLLFNRNDEFIGRSIATYGEFSEEELELLAQICKPGAVVVEAGANIGAHTVALASMVGPAGFVLAFEPQRIVFQTLCANLALNSITNVTTWRLALNNEKGPLPAPDLDYQQPGNFGGYSLLDFDSGPSVPAARLDTVVKLKRLDLIKADVEGMEREVIEGARALIEIHQPILYVENDRLDRSEALIETIRGMDYRLFWHLPRLYNPENFAGTEENIFGHLCSANMLCVPADSRLDVGGLLEITDPSFHPFA